MEDLEQSQDVLRKQLVVMLETTSASLLLLMLAPSAMMLILKLFAFAAEDGHGPARHDLLCVPCQGRLFIVVRTTSALSVANFLTPGHWLR